MQIHLSSLGAKVWKSVLNGYKAPTIVDATTKLTREKLDSEWDTVDRENFESNSKALNTLYCSLSIPEFSRISSCATAKEAWDVLQDRKSVV